MTDGRRLSRLCGLLACLIPLALGACEAKSGPPPKPLLPVRTVVAEPILYSPALVLTGEVRPQVQSELSFRVSGRIAERKVEVGEHVGADQVLATIDPQEQQATLNAAQAGVEAAEAQLRQAASANERQKALLDRGYTTRREADQAEQAYRTAQSSLDSAKAQLATARDQLSYTVLRAGAPGIITARNAEVGQVVQAAQSVFTLARDGDRDAVFNVYESVFARDFADGMVDVALVADPSVRVQGRVREVSPTIDATTGTVRVKIALNGGSAQMPLGSAVTGTARLRALQVIPVPAAALASHGGHPAVWTVDPASGAVSLKPVTVTGYGTQRVLIGGGIEPGANVVAAGAQFLQPGQIVAPMREASQ